MARNTIRPFLTKEQDELSFRSGKPRSLPEVLWHHDGNYQPSSNNEVTTAELDHLKHDTAFLKQTASYREKHLCIDGVSISGAQLSKYNSNLSCLAQSARPTFSH